MKEFDVRYRKKQITCHTQDITGLMLQKSSVRVYSESNRINIQFWEKDSLGEDMLFTHSTLSKREALELAQQIRIRFNEFKR